MFKVFRDFFSVQKRIKMTDDLFGVLTKYGSISKRYLVKYGDTVVHLGVWRSETIQRWSELVGSEGKVVIVEADDLNHFINTVEVKRRMLNNVILVNKGAWNKCEKITLQVSDISMRNKIKEAGTIDRINPDSNFQEEKTIDADTLDNILQEIPISKVDHVFMTISGAEIEALEGMSTTIANNNNLSLYIRSTLLNEQNHSPNSLAVVEYLRKLGFKAKAAQKEKDRDGSNVFAVKLK